MTRIDYSPFTTCLAGHDLTQPEAFIYIANGNRICRACASAKPRNRSNNTGYADMGRLV